MIAHKSGTSLLFDTQRAGQGLDLGFRSGSLGKKHGIIIDTRLGVRGE